MQYQLYKTRDGGQSWQRLAIPPQITSVNHVSIDRQTGALYIACGEYTGELGSGGVWRQQAPNAANSSWEQLFFMPYVMECYPSSVPPKPSDHQYPEHVFLPRIFGITGIYLIQSDYS